MTKRNKLFTYQHHKTMDGAIEGVQHHLSQGTKLTCTIPAISAMNQHTAAIRVDIGDYPTRSSEDGGDVLQPVGGRHIAPLGLAVPRAAHLTELLERLADHVDVGDATVLQVGVGLAVVAHCLCPPSRQRACRCIHLKEKKKKRKV